ncbi:MAG: PAS domain-containing protein [Alphaproteobacteria bacterium]
MSRFDDNSGASMDGSTPGLTQNADDTLRDVLDTLGGGVIVFDSQWQVVMANALAAELLDVPPELIAAGKSWLDFIRFAAERGDYGPGDVEANIARVVEMVSRREAYTLTRQRPDGAVLEIHGRPIRDGFVTRFRDITDQHRNEEALRELTGDLPALVDETIGVLMERVPELKAVGR